MVHRSGESRNHFEPDRINQSHSGRRDRYSLPPMMTFHRNENRFILLHLTAAGEVSDGLSLTEGNIEGLLCLQYICCVDAD